MKTVHILKIEEVFFEAVVDGRKTFEVRKDDRGFKDGDDLILVDQCDGKSSGRWVEKRITFTLKGWGIKDGYMVLAVADVTCGVRVGNFVKWPVV